MSTSLLPDAPEEHDSIRGALGAEAKRWVAWAFGGAIAGGLLGAGVGFWLAGFVVAAIGLGIGAVAGAIAGWIFYLWASSFML